MYYLPKYDQITVEQCDARCGPAVIEWMLKYQGALDNGYDSEKFQTECNALIDGLEYVESRPKLEEAFPSVELCTWVYEEPGPKIDAIIDLVRSGTPVAFCRPVIAQPQTGDVHMYVAVGVNEDNSLLSLLDLLHPKNVIDVSTATLMAEHMINGRDIIWFRPKTKSN